MTARNHKRKKKADEERTKVKEEEEDEEKVDRVRCHSEARVAKQRGIKSVDE